MSITRHHNEWLSLVPNSGPFLSLPVLASAFPQGLDAHDADHARRLRMAFEEWDENQSDRRLDPGIRRAWIKLVLGETLGYEELLAEGQEIPQTLKSEIAEHGETLRPDWVVNDPATKKARLLVQVYPRSQPLTKPVASSRWKTSPDTRMMQLLHDTGIRVGIVTNGDHWMLVNAPKNETTGYASWYANLWLDEPVTLRAFRTLLSADRFFSVPENETLEALLDKSAGDQQEVTDQLGYQVRKAVEVLIQALDKADHDHGRKLLADVDEKVLYESALTVMMRLVFLFCAEERELLLLGDELYDRNYAVSTLREQLRVAADQFGEEILGLRYDAWTRLLTTFRAVYAGVQHDRLKLPPYGGSLFNPDRFPFLEGRKLGTSWKDTEAAPLPVSNRTVLHLLEALQVLQVRLPGGATEARKLSFRELNIEQIGHVYEGLLDHTAKRATEPVLGLQGTRDKEPEIALSELEKIAAKGEKDLLKFLKDQTGRSESALKKGLKAELDDQLASRFRTACQDSHLWERVKPFAGLVRLDTVGYPVVVTAGSVFVTGGADRRSSGTHYTPRSLTEPIVQYTLEPLVYVGPAEGLPKEQWKLKSAKELLDLKICDMACGSGAFLVQACRYLSERLLEAWHQDEHAANVGHQQNLFQAPQRSQREIVRITPFGFPSKGGLFEQLVPLDLTERQTYALRIVAQRCLYGVDKNPLAVEMAKLSLWLLTLAKDKPFEFLDHAIRCGDSLIGIHDLEQLKAFDLKAGSGVELPVANIVLQFMDKQIKDAVALRRQITEMQSNSVEDVEAQEARLREANEKLARLKCAADFLISAEFVPGSAADKRTAKEKAAIKVAAHFNDSDSQTFRREAQEVLLGQTPFHWPLEFPEVMVERGGFDALVGNPPFMGGTKLEPAFGSNWREYLVSQLAQGRRGIRGTADLCVYFFLQASRLCSSHGNFGLLATNTIAQGDSKEVGLSRLRDEGMSTVRAIRSLKWPGTASLEVSCVWMAHGPWNGLVFLDESAVPFISPSLDSLEAEVRTPFRLAANDALVIEGVKISGEGFIVSNEEAADLVKKNLRNSDVVKPFLTGKDLNSRPDQSPSRHIINFQLWPLSRDTAPPGYDGPVASDYPDCLRIVEQRVKPERLSYPPDSSWNRGLRERWWQLGLPRPALIKALQPFDRVLVRSRVSNLNAFAFVPTHIVFADVTNIFFFDDFHNFSVLQSSLHTAWLEEYASTMKRDIRYTPASCFDTLVRPHVTSQTLRIGDDYYTYRNTILKERQIGLTPLYQAFNSSDDTSQEIQNLREKHVQMDHAVVAAYSWTDLDLGHGFHETKQGVRYTISEPARREVLARLLKLNHERYAEEVKQGLHEKKKPKAANRKKKTAKSNAGATLFAEE